MSRVQSKNAAKRSGDRGVRWRGLGCCALLTLGIAASCEDDMNEQPRYDPFEPSALFADGRSVRPPVPGTIHRGELIDPALTTGIADGRPVEKFPLPITSELLLRGQERFNIYCMPCHSLLGDGDGVVVRRGFRRPPSLHDERLRQAPVGHLFEVITHGFATMPRFGYLLTEHDRWAIAAYIRVLQHSQRTAPADVPPEHRSELEQAP